MRRIRRALMRSRLARRTRAASRFALRPMQAPPVIESLSMQGVDAECARALADLEAAIAALEGPTAAREALAR